MQGLLKSKNLVFLFRRCCQIQEGKSSLHQKISYQFFGKKGNQVSQQPSQAQQQQLSQQSVQQPQIQQPIEVSQTNQGTNSTLLQNQTVQQQPGSIDLTSQATSSDQLNLSSNDFSLKIDDPSIFNNLYIGEHDIGNITSAISPLNEYPSVDFISKLSYLTPSAIYEQLDIITRESLFYLANEMGWGLGLAIAGVSLGIKLFFMPLMISTQINAVKMKLLEPEMKNFNNQVQRLSKMGDYGAVREAQRTFAKLRRHHGIKNWLTVLSLTQIPVLITWFLSLRYIANMPDKYPTLKTEGLLWFKDLSVMDPYCILPLISCTLSYYNISLNPNLSNSSAGSVFGKYMRYMRFLPFFSLPIVLFFPSALNLYWAISAATHLMVAIIVRSPQTRKIFGIPEYLPGTILERQNQKYKAKVIKTVINDTPKATAEKIAFALGSKDKLNIFVNKPKSSNSNQEINQNVQQQQQKSQVNKETASQSKIIDDQPQQQTSQKINNDNQQSNVKQSKPQKKEGQEGVQIFTNKPRKKK